MSSKVDFRRVFLLAGVAGLAVIYLVLWMRLITSRAERTGSDFIAFYAAGRVASSAGMAHVYDPDLQQAVQQEQVGFELVPGQVLLYNHLPFLVPLLTLLVDGNYVASFYRWAVLLLACYGLSIWISARVLARKGFSHSTILYLSAGMLTFFPLFVSLLNGQDTSFLYLGASLWLAGLLLERDPLAGLGLALTVVRPNIALLLAIPFLFRRQKVFLWFGLGAAVLAALSLLIIGIDGTRAYIDILAATAGGDWYGMKESAMLNLIGLLRRAFPSLDKSLVRTIGWGVYALSLIGLCIFWAKSSRIAEKQAGLAVLLAVFTVPHLHYHDLTLLLVPLLGLVLMLVREGHLGEANAAMLPLGLSLILLFSYFVPPLKYGIPYLAMLLLALGLFFPDRLLMHKSPVQEGKR